MVQNVKGKAIPGTVRWGGQMTAAGKVVVPVVIGMETVSITVSVTDRLTSLLCIISGETC